MLYEWLFRSFFIFLQCMTGIERERENCWIYVFRIAFPIENQRDYLNWKHYKQYIYISFHHKPISSLQNINCLCINIYFKCIHPLLHYLQSVYMGLKRTVQLDSDTIFHFTCKKVWCICQKSGRLRISIKNTFAVYRYTSN